LFNGLGGGRRLQPRFRFHASQFRLEFTLVLFGDLSDVSALRPILRQVVGSLVANLWLEVGQLANGLDGFAHGT
jgi:hypothetical protein